MFEFPLEFGNVTVAVITLMLSVGFLALLYEVGIRLVTFCLAFDSEYAPKVRFKNVIWNKVSKYLLTDNIHRAYGGYIIKDLFGAYDKNDGFCWTSTPSIIKYCVFTNKEDAMSHCRYNPSCVSFYNIGIVLIVSFLLDTTLKMLTISFLPTITVVGVVSLVFAMRYISKSLYKGMYDKQQQLNNHEERITKMEEEG